jgi:hypothetical protein
MFLKNLKTFLIHVHEKVYKNDDLVPGSAPCVSDGAKLEAGFSDTSIGKEEH